MNFLNTKNVDVKKLETQLAEKVNKQDVYLKSKGININDFDEPTRQTFLEAQGIDVNYVLGEGNVKTENTDFIEKVSVGFNSLDISNQFTIVGKISTLNGTLNEASTTDRATNYIDVTGAEFIFRYVLDGSSTGKYTAYHTSFYDESYTFISGWYPSTTYEIETFEGKYGLKYPVPTNAKYARMSMPLTNVIGESGNDYSYLVVTQVYKHLLKDDYNTLEIQRIDNELNGINVKSHLQNKKIACFGDSIFGNFRDGTGIPDVIANNTGATVYNFGFGGTTMALRDGVNPQDIYWDEFSMCRIADYIASGNFTPMDNALANMTSPLSYFASAIAELKTINWNEINIITIEHGTNDFTQGIKAKDELNKTDKHNYYGAYHYAIETLLTAHPHLIVVILTPTWRFWRDGETYIDGADTYVVSEQKLTDLVSVAKETAKDYHLPVMDNYYELNMNKITRNIYLQDGVHPNTEGRLRIGNRISHTIEAII